MQAQTFNNPAVNTVIHTKLAQFSTALAYRIENMTPYVLLVSWSNTENVQAIRSTLLHTVAPFESATMLYDWRSHSSSDISLLLDNSLLTAPAQIDIDTYINFVQFMPGETPDQGSGSSIASLINFSAIDQAPGFPFLYYTNGGQLTTTPVIDMKGWNGVIMEIEIDVLNPGQTFAQVSMEQSDDQTFASLGLIVLVHTHHKIHLAIPRLLRYMRPRIQFVPDGGLNKIIRVQTRRTQDDVQLKINGHQVTGYYRNYICQAGVPLNMYMPVNPALTRLAVYATGSMTLTINQTLVDPALTFNQYSMTIPASSYRVIDIPCQRSAILTMIGTMASNGTCYLSSLQREVPPL